MGGGRAVRIRTGGGVGRGGRVSETVVRQANVH